MLRKVLWVAAACAAILLALWVSRALRFDRPPPKSVTAAASPAVEAPAPAVTPPPPPVEAKPPRVAEDQQVQEDAAATGMTTMEPQDTPANDEPPI